MERDPQPTPSKEYLEQLAIEGVAKNRYPNGKIKEIQPGFDAGGNNYVWLVILETEKPFENTMTTVDTNDIRAWYEENKEEKQG